MNLLVNINGKLIQTNESDAFKEASVSVFDRGFLYGDSLYEVVRSYDGKFYKMDEHLERLRASAQLCQMTIAQSVEDLEREVHRTYDQYQKDAGKNVDAYCRIIITRGVGRIGFGLGSILTPSQYVIILMPVGDFAPAPHKFEKGFHLQISERLRNDRRALDPAMKSGNYLNSLLAYLDAAGQDFDDALLCNADAHVTEGTTFNIFYARNGIIATPPLDIGILDGITRRSVIEVARAQGFEVREIRFPKERLYEADEVFMTSSVKEVFPVTRIDKIMIGRGSGAGKPGPITRKLAAGYAAGYLTRTPDTKGRAG